MGWDIGELVVLGRRVGFGRERLGVIGKCDLHKR